MMNLLGPNSILGGQIEWENTSSITEDTNLNELLIKALKKKCFLPEYVTF